MLGDNAIQIVPDRMHSQKKGKELDNIILVFNSVDICDKWYKALINISGETKDKKKKDKNNQSLGNDIISIPKRPSEPMLARKKKDKSLYPQDGSPSTSSYIVLQPSNGLNNNNVTEDNQSLVVAVKELQLQNSILTQKVNSLLQDVAYLKSLAPAQVNTTQSFVHSGVHTPISQPSPLTSPLASPSHSSYSLHSLPNSHQPSPSLAGQQTHNPFATTVPTANPFATTQPIGLTSSNPFATNYTS